MKTASLQPQTKRKLLHRSLKNLIARPGKKEIIALENVFRQIVAVYRCSVTTRAYAEICILIESDIFIAVSVENTEKSAKTVGTAKEKYFPFTV